MSEPRIALPIPELPKDSVEIGGETVWFHSLSRSEALKLQSFKGKEDAAEDWILSCGTDLSLAEAKEWRSKVNVETAGLLIDGIIILSGLQQEKPGSKA